MIINMCHLGFFAFLSLMLFSYNSFAVDKISFKQIDNQILLDELRKGGYVIYFLHAQTEKDYADQVTADPNNGSTQRVLSEPDWIQAKGIGRAFRELKIPVGKVISSQYFRAWQMADLAFGKYEKNAALNLDPAENYTDKQMKAMYDRVIPLVTTVPEKGLNTVLVGHDA